ncbi:GOLD domain [Dillenia turbinata]|uniref:GOLD domain n=1 Tax=Dillenia turbinata TaxID=194707 RepID=A0AAN8UV57_9MAGN
MKCFSIRGCEYDSDMRASGIELELQKLEGAVEAIHENLIYLMGSFSSAVMVLEELLPEEEAYLDVELVFPCRRIYAGNLSNMRTVSESTNERVAWFSIMSLGICIAVSVLQLWYLKSFFQKKKLI